MYKILTQYKGQLKEINESDQIKLIKTYKRGKYVFTLDNRPKCKICGSDLEFIKKGKYLIINKCLNESCLTNDITLKKGAPIKWKAFLPDNILEYQHNLRVTNNSFNIDYLIKEKGYTYENAKQYIKQQKQLRILNGLKNKGANRKEQYIKKYGEELGLQKLKMDSIFCIEHWLNLGYSYEDAKEKISQIQKNNSKRVKTYGVLTKEYLNSHGYDADMFMKERSIYCVEYYLKRGFSKEYAINKIKEYQAQNSRKQSHETIINRSLRRVEYWIKHGYSLEESKKIISNYQITFSKEICIQKYGIEKGLIVFKDRQERWQKTLHDNGTLHVGYSKISQDLFNILKTHTSNDIYYGSYNREYTIYNNENKHVYAFDYTDLTNKKIIEFQGDIYHGNPMLFNEDELPNPGSKLTAKQLWERDNYKKNIAINNGFDILYIWENDYKNNKDNVINKCLEFLCYD